MHQGCNRGNRGDLLHLVRKLLDHPAGAHVAGRTAVRLRSPPCIATRFCQSDLLREDMLLVQGAAIAVCIYPHGVVHARGFLGWLGSRGSVWACGDLRPHNARILGGDLSSCLEEGTLKVAGVARLAAVKLDIIGRTLDDGRCIYPTTCFG